MIGRRNPGQMGAGVVKNLIGKIMQRATAEYGLKNIECEVGEQELILKIKCAKPEEMRKDVKRFLTGEG